MKRYLLSVMLCVAACVSAWGYVVSKDFGDGKKVNFSDDGADVQKLEVTAGGLAAWLEWYNQQGEANRTLSKTSRTKLVISGTMNADDLDALAGSEWVKFEQIDMDGVTLEDATSRDLLSINLPSAEYIALPYGTDIATMKSMKANNSNLKAVACNSAANGTEFTGYSWSAGEIYNICQLNLVDGITAGVCANTMTKLTIGGNVDDRDVSTAAATSNVDNKNWTFAQGNSQAQYYVNESSQSVKTDYLKPTHEEKACSPWKGATEISLDFTEAIFSNFGDLAVVSQNVTELLMPTDKNFTEIKPFMFADLPKLKHIIIPNNIVTVGDAAFYVKNDASELKEISIGNGVKTIGNAAFASGGRAQLEDVRFAAGISDVKILSSVFSGCTGIKHMTLPEGVVTIGESCFYQLVSLESVHFPTTLTYIGRNCFKQTGITLLTIPSSVKIIDYTAFDLCRITDIYLMAETVDELPYIFAAKYDYINSGSTSTFNASALNGNNTTPQTSTRVRSTEEMASKTPTEAEEYFRLNVKEGNTITRLHYTEGVESFINLNPWYYPGQTTPKPSSETFSGADPNSNGGINEEEGLSDTYYFIDDAGNTYPAANANDLARPSYAAYFNSNSHAWDASGANTDYSKEDGSSMQTQYYNPETGELVPFTEVTTHMWQVLRKEGWRQFTFRAGDAGSEDVVFSKEYDNVWYTMCFPFSLTDEQLETAFNAEYNIADFSGVELQTEDSKKTLVLHFNKIAKAKYFDLDHNEYERVSGSKEEHQMGSSKFNVYTYTRDGSTYKYVETYSNKSYAKDGNKANGIVYIDGYLAVAGHPYMIHPNFGTSEGDKTITAHMVNLNYYSTDASVIEQLCKDNARSVDMCTGKTYKGDARGTSLPSIEETENFDQKAYGSAYNGQTYTFIGNCNDYAEGAPEKPTVANGGLKSYPPVTDYTDLYPTGPTKAEKGEEPSADDVKAAVGERKTEADKPTPVDNPNYGADFEKLYNTEFSYWVGGTENKTTIGDAFANYSVSQIKGMGLLQDWDTYATGNSDLASYLGVNTYTSFDESLITDLISKCQTYKAYNEYLVALSAYNANVYAWAAYDAAHTAWENYSDEQAQKDYEDALAEYNKKVAEWEAAKTQVDKDNAKTLSDWEKSAASYRVYIPKNAYFLSRRSTEYYTRFFRETGTTGAWNKYSAVLIPNEAAVAGIEKEIDSKAAGAKGFAMAFDEEWQAVTPTEIEEIVADAEEKGVPVEFVDVVISINGQIVKRGDTSLQGLPRGMYIVNGKKYFVK